MIGPCEYYQEKNETKWRKENLKREHNMDVICQLSQNMKNKLMHMTAPDAIMY